MVNGELHLAIETSSRCGSIALGRGGVMLGEVALAEQQRHAVGLMPQVAALFAAEGVGPGDLGVVSVSVGPGSFTGLRIAVTVAKMLSRTTGCRVVAVPTLEVVAANGLDLPELPKHLAVCLNAKRGAVYTGLFAGEVIEGAPRMRSAMDATLMTPAEIEARLPRPLMILADKLPPHDWSAEVQLASAEQSIPQARHLWQLAEARIADGNFADPYTLVPAYIREPEAETLWAARQAGADR